MHSEQEPPRKTRKSEAKVELQSPTRPASASSVAAADAQLDKQLVPFDNLTQRQKRTEQMKFTRTLKGEIKEGDDKKCPLPMRKHMAANPNKYFRQWYDCHGSYKQLSVHVKTTIHQDVSHFGKRKWMREDEVYAAFPAEVADAKMNHLRGTVHHKKDPQAPECKKS